MDESDARRSSKCIDVEIHDKGVAVFHKHTLRAGKSSEETSQIFHYICCKLIENDKNFNLLLENFLRKVIHLTNSKIGSVSVRSDITSNSCPAADDEPKSLVAVALGEKSAGLLPLNIPSCPKKFKGLFGHTLTNEKIIISNHVKSDPRVSGEMPKNHPKIRRFIGFPLFYKGFGIGMLSLANSRGNYSYQTVHSVMPLLGICSSLLIKAVAEREPLCDKIQKLDKITHAKDRFLATMSHEIRTPLNGIMGMVQLLPGAGPMNDKQKAYVRNLTECTVELTSLLNNILDFSKMASDNLKLAQESLFIPTVVQNAVKMVEGQAKGKNLKLKTEIDPNFPVCIGDNHRLLQVLSNLLSNSCKYTNSGGVYVKVWSERFSEKTESTSDLIPIMKQKIFFEVTDTGIGIPASEQDKIFEVFHQSSSLSTYQSSSGTGLGLSISREIVRLMGGRITVESTGIDGEGSTFTFFIVVDEEINLGELKDKTPYQSLKGVKILIVDDRPEIRLQLSDMLFKWGCIPQAVSSAEEALQYLHHQSHYKVVLIDICMPEMSGVELAQEIRLKYPHLPLIGISSVDLSSGEDFFDHYMRKPISQNVLLPAVLESLRKHRTAGSRHSKRKKKPKSRLKILVAEDNAHNIYTLNELLLSLGFKERNIELVSDGEQCIESVKRSIPDVILMDIRMPRMDGLQATKIIKRLPHSPMIVAISAAVLPSDKEKCQYAGIDAYLPKPVDREKLKGVLDPLVYKGKGKGKGTKRKPKSRPKSVASSTSKDTLLEKI